MSWIILSCIPPFLFSLSNIIDEFLVKYHFAKQPMVFLIIACALEILPAILMIVFYEPALDVPIYQILMLSSVAILATLSIWPYLIAVRDDGAGIAVPFFQLIPVMVFVLGWLFLGELISAQKTLAAALIITAACVMSWDFETKKIPLRTAGLMVLCCVGIAIFTIVLRDVMQDVSWLAATTWVWFGNSVFAILTLLLYKPWRDHFVSIFKTASLRVTSLFIGQAILDNVAGVVYILALSLAPAAALVQTMNGLQPLYILMLTLIMGIILPQYFPKIEMNKILLWRILCAVFLFMGIALLLVDL